MIVDQALQNDGPANQSDPITPDPSSLKAQIDSLKSEKEAMRRRLSKLSEAGIRISQSLDFESVMQEVVDSARSLTGARYGVLLTYDNSGDVQNVIASGISVDEIQLVGAPPVGLGLLGYINEVQEPLRISDISSHPMSVGFPENHPPMKSFLGMQVRHHGIHLGNIFLTEKVDDEEFTSEDEETLVMFAVQAGQAISNARQYQEVQRAKADLETLIDISPVGVGVFDAKSGVMVSYNQEMHRMVGGIELAVNSPEPLMKLLKFRRADGRVVSLSDLPIARVMRSGEVVRADEVIVDFPDGRSIKTLINAAPMFAASGEITAVVITVQDMEPLEDMEKFRGEFLGIVSQELRKPLSTIKGSTSALMDILKALNPTEAIQLLNIVDQQADLMRSQINSLVELTQIESGALSISPSPVRVSELLEISAREFLRKHPGTALDVDVPAGMPLIMADSDRLSQVIQNLFAQVSRATPSSSSVEVSASLLDFYVSISVSFDRDSAPGEAFVGRQIHPLDEDARNNHGERDLAYAYCRGVVEAHGGRFRVEQGDRGYGITYTLTIPTTDETSLPATEALPDAARQRALPENPSQTHAKILLAIPDARTMGAVRRTLANADYPSVSTNDLNDVERLLVDEKPDLVVLDLQSIEPGGLRLTQHMAIEYDTAVIVLSGKGDEDNVVRAFDAGADDYIVKPFSSTELVARIKSSLKKRSNMGRPMGQTGYAMDKVLINYDERSVSVSGTAVQLTATEYKLLFELSSSAGRVLTQDELLYRVWGPEYSGEPQLLRSYVKSLRQKLGDDARNPTYIFTEHGVGYRMAKSQLV